MKEAKKFDWDIPNVKRLFVHSISSDTVVVRNSESKISLEIELSGFKKDVEEYEPKVKIDTDRFEIDLSPHTSFFPDGFFAFGFIKFGGLEIQKISLKIPDGLSFGMETTSGDTLIDGLSFDELRISSVSGDFDLNSKMKHLFLKTVSGNTNIKGSSSKIEKMELQSISGDLKFSKLVFGRGIIKTTSGDINLTNVDPDFETLDVKTVSGDFSVSFTSMPNVRVETDTVSGDVKSDVNIKGMIRKAFDIGKPLSTLKFKSISGDANFEFGSFETQDQNLKNDSENEDERLKIFEEILKSKRATKDEIKTLMKTIGYDDEKIEKFLSGK